MSGHTPGPWMVSPIAASSVRQVENERGICSTGGYHSSAIRADVLNDENEANAALIAAAPDLLDACEAFCDAVDEGADMERLRAIVYGVRALAIKPAKGEKK